jgi:predicted RNA binding protein YcfA (HicA-like mRNA interferase family)
MPRRLSSTETIKVLSEQQFYFVSQHGSHAKFKHADGRMVIVPHPKKELPMGTLRSVIRQSGLDRSLFGY